MFYWSHVLLHLHIVVVMEENLLAGLLWGMLGDARIEWWVAAWI
jgi:hypothetical protein